MNPTDLPRITGVVATSLVCKMAEVVGVHHDVNSLVVEVLDLESDEHWQDARMISLKLTSLTVAYLVGYLFFCLRISYPVRCFSG